MSQTKKLKSLLLAIFSILSFFAFGCEKEKVAVNKIDIRLESQQQVVMLVDEFFNIGERVEVSPNYANDKTFSIYSLNESVVRVVGNQIKAVAAGETFVRVVSNTNENVEDVVLVTVYDTQSKLPIPTNLKYNPTTQTFTFNAVDNAFSYTININDREFNIGNVTAFELSNYVGERFNNVLTVKVRANASSYSKAFVTSDFTKDEDVLKIYQTEEVEDLQIVGGKLTFTKNPHLTYDVYFDNTKFLSNANGEVDLLLDEDFAGLTKKVSVVANASNETKLSNGVNVDYVPSRSKEVVLNILDEPDVKMIGGIASWNAIAFASGYEVFYNDEKITETKDNYCDLNEFEIFNNISSEDGDVEIKVVSKLSQNSINIAKTSKVGESVKFSKLATPNVTVVGNSVEWQSVENASAYFVQVKNETEVKFAGSTTLTSFDFSKLGAATYTIEVGAVANNNLGNYISSKIASVTITKHAQTQAQIEDYILKIDAIEGEKYLVNFNINNNNDYNEELTASSNCIEIDLSIYNFKAGKHDIKITRLGNGTNSIDGELKVVSFTQLEAVSVSISNSTASVARSTINKDAVIYLETTGVALTAPIKVNTIRYEYNSTDLSKENCLTTGEYNVVAYVEGNGSSTFSVRDLNSENKKQAVACGEKTFTVLEVPSLDVLDKSKAEVYVNKVNYATNYSILDESGLLIDNVNEKYTFNLASGEVVKLRVRANGNGSSTLTSLSSSVLTVKRLVTPELTFNAANNSFSLVANNNLTLFDEDSTVFSFNDGATAYTFGETFTGLKVGDNNFKVCLVSKGEVDGVCYINSLNHQINVYKLSNSLTASVGNDNKLKVENPENGSLILKIDDDETEYTAQDGKVAGLDYIKSANDYVITLLGDDYKAIIPSMANGFAIKTKFARNGFVVNGGIKRYYTDSDWSDECNLTLTKLTAVAKIYSNTENKIVIKNPNSEKLYLDMFININGDELKFADNGREQLIYNDGSTDIILTYEYSEGTYFVDLYESNNIKLNNINKGDNFGIKVQLKKTISGSDIDSAVSNNVSVTYLYAPMFVREAQNISFVSSVADYGLDKYKLLVNNSTFIDMDEFSANFTENEEGSGLTKYTISMVDLWNSLENEISGFDKTDVNSLRIEILNSETSQENVLLGSLGEEVCVQQAESFEVKTRKTNGLTSVEVQSVSTEYAKTYAIDVLGETEYANNDGSIIKISLDDKEFSGNLIVKGYVKANSSYISGTKTVYVFNSVMSDSLTISRLAAPTLSVINNKIQVSGATTYEVYKLLDGNYVKVEETELDKNGNNFIFKNLIDEFTIKVKATTTNSDILNSNLSSEITIKKLGKATASVIGGKVGITLPSGCKSVIESGSVAVKLSLNLNNRAYECLISSDYSTSVSGINWSSSSNAFMVDSSLIFDYVDDYMVEKMLAVTLELNGEYDGKHYLYSDIWQTQEGNGVKALFAPTDIMVNKQDANFETISWANNEKNKLNSTDTTLVEIDKYVFVFIYEGKPYYSTDVCLKYLSGTNYISYGDITGTNTAFPYGYDANNDGDFEDSGDTVFTTGEYQVGVAAYSNGYVTSPYSEGYNFRVLPTTTLSIDNGKLVWEEVPGATKYVVRIRDYSRTNLLKTVEVVSGLVYDFEDFELSNNLYDITVQAITDRLDTLNSKESDSLAFYRLKTATKVEVDDGLIKITGSPFVYAIDIEFNGNTYRFTNPKQEENLTSAGLGVLTAGDVVYGIDLASSFPHLVGTSGTIKVRMCGNTGTKTMPMIGTVGMINSKTTTNPKALSVLNLNVNNVKSGVWEYVANSEVGSTDKAKINYNFNNVVNAHPFWLDTVVYQISINVYNQGTETKHVIYSVDYDRFKYAVDNGILKKYEEDNSAQSYYELLNDKHGLYARIVYKYKDATYAEQLLYFNVYYDVVKNAAGQDLFKGNIINLQDHDVLYYNEIIDNNNFTYTGNTEIQYVDLAAGGSFIINIKTLGGDDGDGLTYSYLNAANIEQTFVRFGRSYAATSNGQLVFTDLSVEGYASPIYKVGVYKVNETDIWWVYLFDNTQCSEEDVRNKFGLTTSDIVVPIEKLEATKQVTFDLGKYFAPAAYNIDIRALAGINADDYLLNAKKPTEEDKVMIKILTAPKPEIKNGNIVFELSSVNNDGIYSYSNDYEITVKDISSGSEYVEEFGSSSANVLVEQIVKGNETIYKLTYILPSSIGGLNITSSGNYEFKIRALTSDAGIVNSPYLDIDGNGDDYVVFTRQGSVSNVTIENGILKWTGVSGESNYLIKVVNNNNNQILFIDKGYINIEGNTYSYEFKEQEFQIWGEGTRVQLVSNVNYTISVSRIGDNVNVISSAFVDESNVYRLNNVNAEQFIANKGLLTWQQIENNNGYSVVMINTGTNTNYNFVVSKDVTEIDFSEFTYNGTDLLPAGKYKAYIRALGNEKINSLQVESLLTFEKLKAVTTYELNGSVIIWNEVENAQGYKVVFDYTSTSNRPVHMEYEVDEASVNSPTDVSGKLTITIQAISDSSSDLLNSDYFIVTTSNDVPKPILDLTYNSDLNRFEWKIDEDDFTDTDNMFITYDFVEYVKNGNLANVNIKVLMSRNQDERYDETSETYYKYMQNYYDANNKVYYLPITIMGGYSNFKVAVQRPGTIDAVSASINRGVDWFKYGAGTQENPYVLDSEQSLLNIKYYPTSYYKLINNINISNTYNSTILNFEFGGNIDGASYNINLGEMLLIGVQEFALFKELNGATINNLNIIANITNTISGQISGDVKIALLAVDSFSSTLYNVKILTSSIVVKEPQNSDSGYEVAGKLYVSGLFAIDNGSNLTSCRIDKEDINSEYGLKIDLYLDVETACYVGAISSYAQLTNVDSCYINFEVVGTKNSIRYLGGMFGRYIGDNARIKGVFNSTMDITINNVKAYYVGGIAGYAEFIKIENNTVQGNINYSGIGNENIFFGGVAGVAISSLVYVNVVEAQIQIVLNSVNATTIVIGKVIGSIEVSNDVVFELKGLYTEDSKTNLKTNDALVLGLYGQVTNITKFVLDKNFTVQE